MRIDAHIHIGLKKFCNEKKIDLNYNLFNDYKNTISVMDSAEIDKAVIFPVPHFQIDAKKSNDYVYEAYLRFPERFIPFCRIDENLEDNLVSGKFKGVKIHLLYEQLEIKKLKKELQVIEDAGVPVVVHALFPDKVKQIEKMLNYAPNLIVILAHMGRGHLYTGGQVVDNALGLKKYPNVYFDLSTVGDKKSIINACEILGYDRVIFGSDYPFGKAYYGDSYSYINEVDEICSIFDGKEKELVLGDNIERILSYQNPDNIRVRRAKKSDYESIIGLFESIDETEKKFLALKNKYTLIKQIIKSERHCYVALVNDHIVGFMRESGRPENYSLLEEIVVDPECRGRGIATAMLKYYHNAFKKNLAKTNAENFKMISLFKKAGYFPLNPDAQRIINWQRDGE